MFQVTEVARVAKAWAEIYNDHPLVQSGVVFAHLSGLMVGGGAAVAADRGALRARRADEATRRSHLNHLRFVHRTVLVALSVVVASGVLLFASDVETFLISPIYWTKTALVVLLAVNGWFLMRTGNRLDQGELAPEPGWHRLAITSVVSLSLWFLVILAGTVLVSFG